MTEEPPKAARSPCPSCPYRRDVPSGIWDSSEYEKLPDFDGEIIDQVMNNAFGLFMCHQQNGCLCSGWIATHGPANLLALRIQPVDESVWYYESPVPVFSSGAEAAAHGMAEIEDPGRASRQMVAKLERLQKRKNPGR